MFANNDALLPFIDVPCHTQVVGRHVKLVTEAAQSVYGERARNDINRNKIVSRKQMNAFINKSDYSFQ